MFPFDQLADQAAWWLSKRELRRLMRQARLPDVVRTTEEYSGHGTYRYIKALHDPRETSRLSLIVQQLQPRRILEIGTCWGGTLFVWCRTNPQADLIISMDLPGGKFGGGYVPAREKLYREFVYDRPGVRLELLRLDSHAESSLQRVNELLEGEPVDFLFIDGDHTYAGVQQDFAMYSPLVAPGGLVALHDINTLAADHEVTGFWNQIRSRYRTEEIIADAGRGEYGIGLVWMAGAAARSRTQEAVCKASG